jgi:hypothetical protein
MVQEPGFMQRTPLLYQPSTLVKRRRVLRKQAEGCGQKLLCFLVLTIGNSEHSQVVARLV